MSSSSAATDDELLRHNRVLGDPTRHAVFTYVRDAPGPVGVAELTDRFGLNHNAIRQHLAKLRDAGLLLEERQAPTGPGRPRLSYRVKAGAAERWGGPSPYETLSTVLLDLLRSERTPREVGRSMGRQLATESGADGDAVRMLDAIARRMGFEPWEEPMDHGVDVVLDRCPFVEQATSSPEIVCEIHRGIAEGIVEQAGDGSTVEDLLIRPPRRAGCRIEVSLDRSASPDSTRTQPTDR